MLHFDSLGFSLHPDGGGGVGFRVIQQHDNHLKHEVCARTTSEEKDGQI